MTLRTSRTMAACLGLTVAIVSAATAQAGSVTTNHTNAQTIVINDAQPADPYPSAIPIAGLGGDITAVTVTLNGFSHTYPGDLNVFMVAPGGQSVSLMYYAGSSGDVNNANLTFSEASAATLGNPITSGTYHAELAPINGPANAQNGDWKLFVSDDASADIGAINGGWTVSITRDQFTTCAAEGFSGSKLTLCRQICEIDQTPTRLTSLIRLYMTTYRSEPPCAAL